MTCPICINEIEEITVAPCYDCRHEESGVLELKNHEHEYHLFRVFNEEIILCDFCDAGFGSYYPDYLGLTEGFPQDYPMELIQKIDNPKPTKDCYCPKCKHRLAFLNFLNQVRKNNAV